MNFEIKWKEHRTGRDKNSDCVKYLNDNFNHESRWFVLFCALKYCLKRMTLEAYYIKTHQP